MNTTQTLIGAAPVVVSGATAMAIARFGLAYAKRLLCEPDHDDLAPDFPTDDGGYIEQETGAKYFIDGDGHRVYVYSMTPDEWDQMWIIEEWEMQFGCPRAGEWS